MCAGRNTITPLCGLVHTISMQDDRNASWVPFFWGTPRCKRKEWRCRITKPFQSGFTQFNPTAGATGHLWQREWKAAWSCCAFFGCAVITAERRRVRAPCLKSNHYVQLKNGSPAFRSSTLIDIFIWIENCDCLAESTGGYRGTLLLAFCMNPLSPTLTHRNQHSHTPTTSMDVVPPPPPSLPYYPFTPKLRSSAAASPNYLACGSCGPPNSLKCCGLRSGRKMPVISSTQLSS